MHAAEHWVGGYQALVEEVADGELPETRLATVKQDAAERGIPLGVVVVRHGGGGGGGAGPPQTAFWFTAAAAASVDLAFVTERPFWGVVDWEAGLGSALVDGTCAFPLRM